MEKLKALVDEHQVRTRPVNQESITKLQEKVGFTLSVKYRDYLESFGVIVYESHETYGLGVPEDYYLNVFNSWKELSKDPTYPPESLPLLDIGDGQYYLYDNQTGSIVQWATPNGGVVKFIDQDIESFLVEKLFG